jgi:hypothetical protein
VSGEDIGAELGAYVVDVRDGTPLVLRGTAEIIWLVAAEGGDLPGDIHVSDDTDRTTIDTQVRDFTEELVRLGLLEEDL